VIVLAFLAVFVSISRAQNGRPVDTERLKLQIERALDAAPRNYEHLLAPRQAGLRLLSVDVRETPSTQTIAIDVSQRALTYEPSGNLEPLLDTVIQAMSLAIGPKQLVEYKFSVEGLPIDRFLPRAATLSRQAQSVAPPRQTTMRSTTMRSSASSRRRLPMEFESGLALQMMVVVEQLRPVALDAPRRLFE
jgi:hypothetical protein